MPAKILNFVLFQLGWLACVLLGATHWHWLAPAVVATVVLIHVSTSPAAVAEWRLIGLALLIGLVWENLLTASGLLVYPHGQPLNQLAPVWILSMWALLATTLNVSLRWLHGNLPLCLLFGATGGPLAFAAGARLEAVTFPNPVAAYAVLSAGWAVLFVVLVCLARLNDGFTADAANHPMEKPT